VTAVVPPPPAAAPAARKAGFKPSPRDLPVLLIAAAAVAVFFALPRLYRPAARPFFPRQASEFLPQAELDRIKASAKAVLEKNPEDINALTELAVAAFQEGPDHALECAENGDRALQLGAFDDRLFYYTGLSYETKGLNDYAAGALEKYLRHRPEDLETRLRLGNLYYRMGEVEKAQTAYRTVLDARPGDPLVSYNLAASLRDRQQWADGIAVLTPVLERDKTLPSGGFVVLGDLYRGAKNNDQALDAYQKELARAPDDQEALAGDAATLEDAGRYEDALAAWQHLLDLNAKNKQANIRVRALTQKVRQAQKKKR
jgi:tetratricopeptide (TPR) repeat protein